MTGLITLLLPYMTLLSIGNTNNSCTLNAVLQCQLYHSWYEFTQEEQLRMKPRVESYRDRLREKEYPYDTSWWTRFIDMARWLQREWYISSYKRVPHFKYKYQPNTIIDLQDFYIGYDAIIRKPKEWETLNRQDWHTICSVGDIGTHWVGLSDGNVWEGGYVLIEKDSRDFYTIRY